MRSRPLKRLRKQKFNYVSLFESSIVEIEKINIKEIIKLVKIIIIFDHFVKNNSFRRKRRKSQIVKRQKRYKR